MITLLGRAIGGLLAGAMGTIGMAGTAFTIRRMVEPTAPIGKTHYEGVVEWANGGNEMVPETRVRAGELTHIGFGALWGMIFAIVMGRRTIKPLTNGIISGLVLWLGAFGGYMPTLGISRSLKAMGNYERGRTLASHLAFAITTFTFLKAFRSEK